MTRRTSREAALLLSAMTLVPRSSSDATQDHADVVSDVAFLSENHVVTVNMYRPEVHVSMDSGASWTTARSPTCSDLAISKGGVVWGYNPRAMATTDHVLISFSRDGGGTWTTIDPDPAVVQARALINDRSELPLVLNGDGQLWRGPAEGFENWSNWTRLGHPNPDERATGGAAISDIVYTYWTRTIWCSFDSGQHWHSGDLELVGVITAMVLDGSFCWGVTQYGEVISTPIGKNQWTKITVDKTRFDTSSIASNGPMRFVCFGAPDHPRCAAIDAIGNVTEFGGLTGFRGSRVVIDLAGRTWFVNGQLFRLDREQWTRCYPR